MTTPELLKRLQMRRTALVSLGIAFYVSAGALAGTQLGDDYSELVEARRSLEERRRGYESELAVLLPSRIEHEAALRACIERIEYPQRLCWEEKRFDRSRRLESLEEQRHQLETARRTFLETGRGLEDRRRRIESRFSGQARGAAYETEFRAYMADLGGYLTQVEDALLTELYDEYLEGVRRYGAHLEQQMSDCRGATSCAFVDRFTELTEQSAAVGADLKAEEVLLEDLEMRLQAAVERWAATSPDRYSIDGVGSMLSSTEMQKLRLEGQRDRLEAIRAQLESERQAIEEKRIELESDYRGKGRDQSYQERLEQSYLTPLESNLERQARLFAQYANYREGVGAYVEFVNAGSGERTTRVGEPVAGAHELPPAERKTLMRTAKEQIGTWLEKLSDGLSLIAGRQRRSDSGSGIAGAS